MEIAHHDVRVSAAGTKHLFARWQEHGDRRARDELIARHMRLARSLAARYRNSSENFDDLVQVAYVGLVNAVDRFSTDRGTEFSSFAVPTILGELRRHFRDTGWTVHVPRGLQEASKRVEKAQNELSGRLGRAPTVSELAQWLEVDQATVLESLQALSAYSSISLDVPAISREDDDTTFGDMLGEIDRGYEEVEDVMTVASVTRHLTAEERELLRLRFAEGLTQTQIAGRIGVSQMQVSRLLRRTIDRLQILVGEK